MSKIQPVSKNLTINIINRGKPLALHETVANVPDSVQAAAGICASGLLVSTFFQNFQKTIEDNYFQFKTDPDTGKSFRPDVFQTASGMNLYLGNDVLVTAPTGTGKTAIAEYIITKNLKEGRKTFYTTPLKALSNEKFLDFSKIYGEKNVGLITGDTKINSEAPVVVMTTEVYRNMAAADRFNFSKGELKHIPPGIKTVIFDELQYLGDIDRGGIWEQALMFTPKDIQILSLSATIGNNTEINDWIASLKERSGTSVTPAGIYLPDNSPLKQTILINVPPENRHVPLNFEVEHTAAEIKVPGGVSKAAKICAKKESVITAQTIYAKPSDKSYKTLTSRLNEEGKLPAIYFIFSKKEGRHLLKFLSAESELLTTPEEQKEIVDIIERYKNDGIYLGENLNIGALLKGYAVHNAGLLPSQKRLTEELFQKKLVKVVLATETLSAGINMPAKTTVISSPRKPASTTDGGRDNKRTLSSNEFHQMAGRAGRRGIDTQGFCIPLSCNYEQTKVYQKLINSPSNSLESNLELDFSFIANYAADFDNEDELRYILSKSLYAYNNGKYNKDKTDELVNNFYEKKEILKKEGFISPEGKLTDKGYLLRFIYGYEQIPILNIINDKTLADLTPVQTAGIIAGLANIIYSTKPEESEKFRELKNKSDEKFVETVQKITNNLKCYDMTVKKLYPERKLDYGINAADHLYLWADLNSREKDSRKNWKELYRGNLRFSVMDEGSLFREITMTSDLLKQLIEISYAGERVSQDEDALYYLNLAKKLHSALELISKEPAVSQW